MDVLDDPTQIAAWTQRLGEHAAPVFAVVLLLLMAATAGAWRLSGHVAVPREQGALPRVAFLVLHLGLGFGLIVSAAGIFASLAENLGDGPGDGGPTMGQLDDIFSAAVKASTSVAALHLFAAITRFGDTETLTVLCIAVATGLVATRRVWWAAAWVLAVAGNGLLNRSLKSVFERVRPEHADGLIEATGYSFPSGHTSGSVVAYGMLAYLAIRLTPQRFHLPALLAATAVAFSTGCSRVFLQVHYASDVMAGLASGSLWLCICVMSCELARYYRRTGEQGATAA